MVNMKPKSNFYNNRYYDESVELNCGDNHWNISANQQQQPTRSKLAEHIETKVQKDKETIDVKVPLKEWMALLDEQNNQKNSIQFSIERANYKAVAEFYNVELNCVFDILVFSNKQKIPLLPSSLAIRNSDIKYSEQIHVEPNQPDTESCIGLHLDAHSFFPEKPGRYQVTIDILANYLTTKKNGMGLSIPNSTFNSIEITVFKKVQISFTEPIIRSNMTENKIYNQDNQIVSHRTASFQPTSYIKVQWTDFEDENDVPILNVTVSSNNNNNAASALSKSSGNPTSPNNNQQQQVLAPKATVEQYTLLTVDEGVVVNLTSLKYSVVSGSLSSFEIVAGSGIKVLSVEGSNIKRWDCNPILPLVNISDNHNVERPAEQLIKVQLSTPVEQDYILRIITEIEMQSTSGNISFTSIRARGSEISREKGYIVVESAANVEVEQIQKEGLTQIDKTEIPNTLVSFTSGPLLLCYKFLDPRYKLDLKVIKHQDLSVLVAICDSAHYMATLSNEGSLLYKLVFRIKNTQQQYIRIKIPHEFNIWSTIVANAAVKPGLDNQNTVMVPLKKSSSGNKGVQESFQVELVYKHVNGLELLNQGKLHLIFPQIDIPISTLYVSLFLPSEYKYSKFTGNTNEVRYFISTPPSEYVENSQPIARPYGRGGRQNQQLQIQQQAYLPQAQYDLNSNAMAFPPQSRSRRQEESISFENDSDDEDEVPSSTSKGDEGTVGLKPIMVSLPKFGTPIKAQQLILLQSEIFIEMNYKMKKSCC